VNTDPAEKHAAPHNGSAAHLRWRWLMAAGMLAILVGLLRLLHHQDQTVSSIFKDGTTLNPTETSAEVGPARSGRRHSDFIAALVPTAEEIVAGKLCQFGKTRRELVHALAKHFKADVPSDVERFFDAVEGGRWEEIDAAHKALLRGEDLTTPRYDELYPFWRPIQEAWGIAREAHTWPAQELLDYGQAVLGSLRPGMIYVGGTDPGCFIPTMLNETSDGEHHIVLTQNALADDSYLNYLNFLYGDRLATLSHEDSQHAFKDYVADAQKRLLHDQQFPDEPKQIRPGENVSIADNQVQVAGQMAVMAVNERLLQTLLNKNPDASFAIEQSFAFKSMYSTASPLGPVMELRVENQQNALTPERAAESVDYWRAAAEHVLSDSEAADSSMVRTAYSKLASEQAALLLNRNYTPEAEQTYRLATEIRPSLPEAVFGYVNLLVEQSRFEDAIPVVENAIKANPENQQFRDLLAQVQRKKRN
jgi:tetratricopeptide (TPR) repeat protein